MGFVISSTTRYPTFTQIAVRLIALVASFAAKTKAAALAATRTPRTNTCAIRVLAIQEFPQAILHFESTCTAGDHWLNIVLLLLSRTTLM